MADWQRIRSYTEWLKMWEENSRGKRNTIIANGLLHDLPSIAFMPVRTQRHPGYHEINSQSDFLAIHLRWHFAATLFCINLAKDEMEKTSTDTSSPVSGSEEWETLFEKNAIGLKAWKTVVALGAKGYWENPVWIVKAGDLTNPWIPENLKTLIRAIINFWADPRMYHQHREPTKRISRQMVGAAISIVSMFPCSLIKSRTNAQRKWREGSWQTEPACRACIHSDNIELLRNAPTQRGLRIIAQAIQSINRAVNITGIEHRFAGDQKLLPDLGHAFFEIGCKLGKSPSEMEQLLPNLAWQ